MFLPEGEGVARRDAWSSRAGDGLPTATEVFAADVVAAGCAAAFFIGAWGSVMLGAPLTTTTGASGEKICAGGASGGVLGTAAAFCIALSADGASVGDDDVNG